MKVTVAAACVPDVKGRRDQNIAAVQALVRQLSGLGAQIVDHGVDSFKGAGSQSAGVTTHSPTHGSLSGTGNPHDAANAFAASSVLEMSPHGPFRR